MDDRNRNPSQQHQSPPALRGWCAVAQPMVRSVSISLARRRHGLGSWDSEDLEQELWLELFVRHSGRDRADNDRCFGGRDVRHCRDEVCSQLRAEVEQIARTLTRSYPFWRAKAQAPSARLHPAPQHPLTDNASDGWVSANAQDSLRRQDLSLDLKSILPELPPADGALCEAMMLGVTDICASTDPEHAQRLAALRADFSAMDLHEYL